jgi:hypothetical protein
MMMFCGGGDCGGVRLSGTIIQGGLETDLCASGELCGEATNMNVLPQ